MAHEFINAGLGVQIASRCVVLVCDVDRLTDMTLRSAIDVSQGTRRAAVFTSDGNVFLVNTRCETLIKRLSGKE